MDEELAIADDPLIQELLQVDREISHEEYCSTNFDIETCPRYAHFNHPFFRTILILRKLNIDVLDLIVITLLIYLAFAQYLIRISEIPFLSVHRYYKIHVEPRKPKISSNAFGKFRLEVQDEKIQTSKNVQDVAATPVSENSFQRSPSISASLCDSEKLANVAATAIVEVNIPHEEALRSVEKWVYNLLKFAFSGPHKNKSGIIAKDWIASLNEQAKKISAGSGNKRNSRPFLFKSVNEKSRTPKLTKLRAEVTPNGTTCIVGHFEAKKLLFELTFEDKSSPTQEAAAFKKSPMVTVEKLIGEVILTPSWDSFSHFRITGSFMGRPQIAKVTFLDEVKNGSSSLPATPSTPAPTDQELTVQVYQCISNTSVDLNLSSCTSLPEAVISGSSPNQSLVSKVEEMIELIKKETLSASATSNATDAQPVPLPTPRLRPTDRRLLVKVIKANMLSPVSNETGTCNPYCMLESDFPAQKHRTNTIHSTVEPFWDEHFLFDIGRRTKYLTVTVYDRDQSQDKNILGQCKVDLLECRRVNVSRHTFKLVNPYVTTGATQHGTVTLELMFMGQGSERKMSPDATGDVTSGGQESGKSNRNSLVVQVGNLTLTDGQSQASPRSSTSVTFNTVPAPDPPNPGRKSAFSPVRRGRSRNKSVSPKRSERSRSRTSENSGAARAIKDWFSRRDRSVDLASTSLSGAGAATDQLQSSSSSSHLNPLQQPLIVRLRSKDQLNQHSVTGAPPGHSPNSQQNPAQQPSSMGTLNYSETSSINSRNSFVNYDQSTLVIEAPGGEKYFLIAKELAKSGKHGLKGSKLHIYNDHTFVATHFTRSETCEVCLKPISKRLGIGKQGYKCRDCEYTCHKGCHYKTELICANSKVSTMEMEFIGEAQLVFQESQSSKNGGRSGENSS